MVINHSDDGRWQPSVIFTLVEVSTWNLMKKLVTFRPHYDMLNLQYILIYIYIWRTGEVRFVAVFEFLRGQAAKIRNTSYAGPDSTLQITLKAPVRFWLNKSNSDGRTCVVLKVIWLPNPRQLLHTNSRPITHSPHPLFFVKAEQFIFGWDWLNPWRYKKGDDVKLGTSEQARLASVSSFTNFEDTIFCTRFATIPCDHRSQSKNPITVAI